MTRVCLEDVRRRLAAHRRRTVPVEGAMKKAAVAAVLRGRDADVEILMIRRAEHPTDPWSGHMAFPGGRVDPEDHGPLGAARREAKEEVALDLDAHGTLIGELSHVPAVAHGKRIPMVIVPYVFELHHEPPLEPDTREVQEVLWVPLSFLLDRANRGAMRRRVAGVNLQLPCYEYEGRTIWGLTLKMLDELMRLLEDR